MSKPILNLQNAILKKMPDNFSFDGDIDLTGSTLEELPAGLRVGGDLVLNDKIIALPPRAIICGDVYIEGHLTLGYDPTCIVVGSIIYEDGSKEATPNTAATGYLILDGERVIYERKKHYTHKAFRRHEYDRTPFDIYYNYNHEIIAVSWETLKGNFLKPCESIKQAKLLVDLQDAIENGIEQYAGLDIDTPILGHKILEIYQICTRSCPEMVMTFLVQYGYDLDKKYTLREIGLALQKFRAEWYAPALDVFLHFFNIPLLEADHE